MFSESQKDNTSEIKEEPKEEVKEETITLKKEEYQKLLEGQKAQQELLYLYAEFDNFKKRQQKVMSEQVCYANEKFIRELIPVIDNFSLALHHISLPADSDNKEIKNLIEGVKLITKQLNEVLNNFGIEEVKSLGTKFDPKFHDAVEHREVEDCEDGSIVKEFQKGYMLNGRLIRPAKVCVAKRK